MMYRIITIEDRIRVPPEKFSLNVKQAVKEAIAEKMEGLLEPRIGVVLAVVDVEDVGEGKILPGDPGIFYHARFKLLVFKPELNDLVYGEVVDNTDFGSFVRIGPIDGLVHISQLMDDFVSYDSKNSVFLGKQTRKTLKEGDRVRARIISISWKEQNKIGLTMRQALLGNLTWIEQEKKKKRG